MRQSYKAGTDSIATIALTGDTVRLWGFDARVGNERRLDYAVRTLCRRFRNVPRYVG